MSQDNHTNKGAPSSDTTSALFVSARKKQLEQQETERRAREKEEERLRAEAEVRRLEAEVAERKRRAEEEAQRVAQEEEQRRRDAAERQRLAEKEDRNPSPMPVPAKAPAQASHRLAQSKAKVGALTAKAVELAKEKPILPIAIGGGLVLVVVAIVLIAVLGGASNGYARLLTNRENTWYLDGDPASYALTTDGHGNWVLYDDYGDPWASGYVNVDKDGVIWLESYDDDPEIFVEYITFIDENSFILLEETFYSAVG